jgi:hypothetical protein
MEQARSLIVTHSVLIHTTNLAQEPGILISLIIKAYLIHREIVSLGNIISEKSYCRITKVK